MVSVVLLGAGASYGSEESCQNTPPLGDKLFERLVEQGGIAAQIPDEIKTLFREKGFETGMAEYYIHSEYNIMRFQRELAHYQDLRKNDLEGREFGEKPVYLLT